MELKTIDAGIGLTVWLVLNKVFILAAMYLVAKLYLRLMKYLKLRISELEN